MIVTRNWLNEWINIEDHSTEKICETLNAIGLEVDSVEKVRIPQKIVVGKVLSCEKHPDADKLNICQVDLGKEVTQIVCGAKNVAAGLTVAVATIGADLGNGFVIKEAKLRGVQSNGMICGSNEIGMPATNEGIMILDESIGALELGRELREYEVFCDDIIDIELTANRGDCLSIHGVARDLGAALNREVIVFEPEFSRDRRGVARVLNLKVEGAVDASVVYRYSELQECTPNVKEAFRLACAGLYTEDRFSQVLSYSTHSSGVILRAYDYEGLLSEGSVVLVLKKDNNGADAVYFGDSELSQIGLKQNEESKCHAGKNVILEASYIDPFTVSAVKMEHKITVDETFYHASRGSETDLTFGLDVLCERLSLDCTAKVYAGEQTHKVTQEPKILKISHAFIENFIGQELDSGEIALLLNRLGLETKYKEGTFVITIPDFRPDISHDQDIIEEIVRLIGIDNIISKPLAITEKRRLNKTYDTYKKRTFFRHKASGAGFYESVHYFFDNKQMMQEYGIEVLDEKLDVSNPISEELNTLRTTLVLHLIDSVSKNVKNGQSHVSLFELGHVVNAQREEKEKMAFIYSGLQADASVVNHGKPEPVNFFAFCDKLSAAIGMFDLVKSAETSALVSPYEYGRVISHGKDIGYIGRLHILAEKEFGLPRTYICEVDFESVKHEKVIAENYAKFPSLSRDLSLIIPDTLAFSKIREVLKETLPEEIIGFYPIDIYEDETLEDNKSITVRFEIQSQEKTLNEEEISTLMAQILTILEEKFHIGLR